MRELFKPVEEFAKTYRTALSLLSTSNLAFIVWQTLSGARDLLFEQRASMIVSVIVLAAAIHVFYLIINYILIKWVCDLGAGAGAGTGLQGRGQRRRQQGFCVCFLWGRGVNACGRQGGGGGGRRVKGLFASVKPPLCVSDCPEQVRVQAAHQGVCGVCGHGVSEERARGRHRDQVRGLSGAG